ncbi:putative tlr signaling inhibitor [Volepox virus]|uniref:Putative tlr signaling inhibitor n=1 Tax=Volepox virus TaxID=28874 RepID=A0A1C9KCN0_9POXV|nr:putative tlr signaling inhibitor [Volepox virus]AOP31891.1 putative tlr signaling inhibitor [Volepox virus]
MDAVIATIINDMNTNDISKIIEELELPDDSSIDDVITKTCETMRNKVLTKLFIQEFNKYMSFSIIVSRTPVRGFHNLIKEYLKMVRTIRFVDAGPILKEFMSYDEYAILHYGNHFIRSKCETVRNIQESHYYDSDDSDDSEDSDDLHNIDLYKKMKRTYNGSYKVDPVPFVKKVIGIASIISQNNLDGYPIFNWNMMADYANNFLHYLETKFVR